MLAYRRSGKGETVCCALAEAHHGVVGQEGDDAGQDGRFLALNDGRLEDSGACSAATSAPGPCKMRTAHQNHGDRRHTETGSGTGVFASDP